MGTQNKSRRPADDGFTTRSAGNSANKTEKKGISLPAISMILVFALFIGVFAYTKIAENGFFYRHTVTVSSENYEVDNAMMSYFFNSQYQNVASYLQQSGVDTTKNLKTQMYSGTTSWFDYIMQDLTVPQVERILVLCEAAKAAGFELSEHDREHIDEAVEQIDAYTEQLVAQQGGGTKQYYLRAMYGYGVNLKDIRKAIELNQLAAAYSEYLTDSFVYGEADWNKYIEDEENLKNLSVIDYIAYTFSASDFKEDKKDEETTGTTADVTADVTETEAVTETVTEAETTAPETSTEAEAGPAPEGTTTASDDKKEDALAAEKVAASDKANAILQEMMTQGDADKARELFDAKIREYLETVVYADETDADKKKEKVDAAMEATVYESAAYDENNKFIKAVFDGDDKTLMKDAFYVDKNDSTGKYTIYMLTKKPALEDYVTKNLRAIVLSASSGQKIAETRDAIIKEFEDGGKTEAKFDELAKYYSQDSEAHENGGLYENQGKGELAVEELTDWLFSADRKAGDYTSVSNGKTGTEEIIYIVYYTGEGMIKWQRDADNALVQEAYEAEYTKLEATHKVETSLKNAYKIPAQAGLE